MELDLGLKITRTRDDITSMSEFRLAKDRAGPVFLSRETNTMFILTAYLKGYKRNNINIMISEDGSQISITGEKPIQELVMFKKDVDITGFKKVFRIPDGVILDRINAKYDGEESMLKIFMPKLVKGICGVGIEELEEEECDGEILEPNQNEADQIPKKIGETSQGVSEESEIQETEKSESIVDQKMEERNYGKMPAETNGVTDGDAMGKEIDASKLEEEDGNGGSASEEVGKEGFEVRTSELEQTVDDHIPDTSQQVSEDSGIQQMEETQSVAEKMDGGESKKMLLEETIEIKEEEDKRKYDETKVAEKEESIAKEKIQESGTERKYEIKQMTESLPKAPETKRPQEMDLGSPQREIPPTIDTGTYPKVARTRSKDDEKEHVKDKPGTKGVSLPDIQIKETHESGKHIVNQDIPEVKKATEEEETEQCTCSMDNTITVEATADSRDEQLQVPRQPSAQQSEVEEKEKIREASQESPKRDTERAFQDSIERKVNQEAEKTETLHPYISLEDHLKGQEEVSTQDQKPREEEEIQECDSRKLDEIKQIAETMQTTPKKELSRISEVVEREGEPQKASVNLADECMEEKEEFDSQEAACGRDEFQEKVCEGTKGPEIVMEDRAQQQMQENIDKEGFETKKVADEELMKRQHGAQTLPDKSEGPKPANMEESKEVSKLSIKTTPTAEDKKPEIKETTPEFEGEKFHKTKQVSGKMQETLKREHKKEPVKAPPGNGVEPPETTATHLKAKSEELKEVKPKTEIEKTQTKENAENSSIHVQVGNGISEADPSKAMNVGFKKDEPKGDIDRPLTKELAHPSEEMLSKDAYELAKPSMEQDASEAETVPHVGEEKEPSNFVQGTEASKDVGDRVAKPSTLPSPPSTQRFEVQGKEQTDECYDGTHGESQELPSPPSTQRLEVQGREQTDECYDGVHGESQVQGKEQTDECYDGTHGESQELPSLPSTQRFEVQGKEQTDECYDGTYGESQESAQIKPDQQVERRETSQPDFSADQQDINYDQQIIGKEESCGEQMIQEETDNEQADRDNEVNSQEDCSVAASDEKKNDKRRSKKLCTPLIIVGSTFLVSVIVFFIHHRRARKSTK